MIRFDKDINRSSSRSRVDSKTMRDKKVKQTVERGTKVDYDFADRDASPANNVGNEMLSKVVKEEDKVEKPKPEKVKFDKKKRQLDKQSKFDSFYDNGDDIELTK